MQISLLTLVFKYFIIFVLGIAIIYFYFPNEFMGPFQGSVFISMDLCYRTEWRKIGRAHV